MIPANKPSEASVSPPSPEQDVVDPLWHRVLNERFTLLEPIGAGGMGQVYKAVQSPLDRIVAIKILNPNYANARDPAFRQRFFLEASLTSKLRHPNTITVLDYGQTADGIFFIAMEYLEGQPLSKLLDRHGPVHWTRALRIAQQIGRSLREAHKMGIVHRDLKPANVMLLTEDRDDLVKVLDFGLVKSLTREDGAPNSEVTNAGMFLGSPQYMAPEQARNVADPRSDIYSLGVLLYHALAGRPPFVARDPIDVIFKQMNEPAAPMRSVSPNIDLPREVEALVMKCLEKQPSWRFPSMEDVLEAMYKAAAAAGMSAIFADATNGATMPAPANTEAPSTAAASRPPEGTLAIDIEVVDEEKKLLSARASRKALAAAIFLSSAAIGLGLTYGLGQRIISPSVTPPISDSTGSTAPFSTSAPLAAEAPAPPPLPTLRTVRFRVSTEPQGAFVSLGDRPLGQTPVTFELLAHADGTATAELLLKLKGYHPMTVITGGSGPEVILTQRLQPRSSKKSGDRHLDSAKPAPPAPSETPEEERRQEPSSTPDPSGGIVSPSISGGQ